VIDKSSGTRNEPNYEFGIGQHRQQAYLSPLVSSSPFSGMAFAVTRKDSVLARRKVRELVRIQNPATGLSSSMKAKAIWPIAPTSLYCS
jgi:hypothetical protein